MQIGEFVSVFFDEFHEILSISTISVNVSIKNGSHLNNDG